MARNDPSGRVEPDSPPMIPLPVTLCVTGELIFELYDDGQPCRRFSICWERLVPAKENEPEASPQSSRTGLHTNPH